MTKESKDIQLEGGAYEIIRDRLKKQRNDLLNRLDQLNSSRKEVFGALDFKLLRSERINTENYCISRDIFSLGDYKILGYNVHIGLRSTTKLADVFSIFAYKKDHFVEQPLDLIINEEFEIAFNNLYKYYRNTQFVKFSLVGGYLLMVFQVSDQEKDVKVFKWLVKENSLEYIDDRSESMFQFPDQHEFSWKRAHRDMQRSGLHPHISINDKVFIETVGGDLTIKIEDNTDDGYGIYSEDVDNPDQTLDCPTNGTPGLPYKGPPI